MKKILSIILALTMLFSVFSAMPANVFAAANLNEPVYLENPFYTKEEISVTGNIDSEATKASRSSQYKGKKYYTQGKELYKLYRNALEARKTKFTLYLLTDYAFSYRVQLQDLLQALFFYSTEDELSESCTDGDYIRWQLSSAGLQFEQNAYKSGNYYYTLYLTADYNDSAAEEKKVDAVVNKFISSIDTNKLTDYQIIKKVHDFVCNQTTYDHPAAEYSGAPVYRYAFSAYGALCKGECVCQGYALAFYRICKELGYSTRFVSSDFHAWNIVELDGKYYFVDCTWDDKDEPETNYKPSYDYFLVDYYDLRKDDTSYYEEHTLEEEFYETEYFYRNYRNYFADKSYSSDSSNKLSTCTIALSKSNYTYTGSSFKPAVTVTSSTGSVLKKDVDYKITYPSNKNPGMAVIKITGLGNYSSSSTHRNFYIYPKKMKLPKITSGSRTDTSLTLEWDRPTGVSGYVIQRLKNGKWTTIKTITSASTTKYKVSSLSPSTIYKFRILAYKTVSKRNINGSYSSVLASCTKPKKPSISKVTTKSKSITASWKKIKCSGYELQYSTNSSMKGAKTIKLSNAATAKKIKSLKKGKKYYFRLRAYKKYIFSTGKTAKYYSSWSTKKSLTCK